MSMPVEGARVEGARTPNRMRRAVVLGLVCLLGCVGVVEAWAFGHARSWDLTLRPGPVGPEDRTPSGTIVYGVTTTLVPGRFIDMADFFTGNGGDSPAVILSVTPHRGSSPAPAILSDVRVLGPDRYPGGGGVQAGSGESTWHTVPQPAVGYVIPAHTSNKKGIAFLITVGPSAGGVTWMQGLDVRYRYDGRVYTSYYPMGIVFCGPDPKRTCPSEPWRSTFG